MAFCAGWGLPHGGMAPLGHGKREGPAGDKLSAAADDAGYGGRVRKERSDWSPPCGSPHPAQLVIGYPPLLNRLFPLLLNRLPPSAQKAFPPSTLIISQL